MGLLVIVLVMAKWTSWRMVPIAAALAVVTQTGIRMVAEGVAVTELDPGPFAVLTLVAYGSALIYAVGALYIVRAWRWWWDPRRRMST